MTETLTDAGSATGLRRRHVLLIDDDQDLADSLASLLALEGYAVTVAHSLSEALASPAIASAQVALVDIRLGLDNGIDLVRALRERRPELVAVMMTAYASQESAVEALRVGAYDYISKPFHSTHLFHTLDRCFEHSDLLAIQRSSRAALEARNRALEDANTRLTGVLASVQQLSRATEVADVAERLLSAIMRDLKIADGAIYWAEDHAFRRRAPTAGHAARIDPVSLPKTVTDAITSRKPVVMTGPEGGADLIAPKGADPVLLAPLADSEGGVLALLVLRADEGACFDPQDLSTAHILASFAAEVIHAIQMHENLARSEEYLRRIVEHSPSAIALSDLQGANLLINDKYREWFIDSGSGGAVARADERWPDVLVDPATIGAGVVTREISLASPDGPRRHLLVTQFPVFDGNGALSGVGAIAADITERHHAEERLRQAQRLEAMGQLTGGIAHDFNNLLAVVLGNLRLIEGMSRTTPELSELVSDALEATRSGADLVRRLLAFGRSQPLQPEPTLISELVRGVSRLIARTLGEAIIMDLDVADDVWNASVDRNQLEASLLNLAINARDAMPNGGRLKIMARNVIIDAQTSGDAPGVASGPYVILAVSDNGVGMSPEVRRSAVQPFFTTKPAGCGSGLGLSIVYGFVRQSGGNLRIDTASGEGTTVTLYFPASPSSHVMQPAHTADFAPEIGEGERILLVEDQAPVRTLLVRLLRRLGYVPVEAPDAAVALIRLAEDPEISVLLTDIGLPGPMDGVKLGEAALAMYPDLGVIFTTGYATEALSRRTGAIAAAPVLAKPVEPEALALTLRTVIGAKASRAPEG